MSALAHDQRLLFAREADRLYRLRNGTVATAWRAGQLPGKKRGRFTLVSAKKAAELWGEK